MNKKWKFKIEEETHDWDKQLITGAEVRQVGPGIPDNMDLFLKRQGRPGQLVKNDDKIDLDEKGIEKFYSQESSSEAGIYGSII
ncbi:multiubiquitin domain-containing protein [Salinimicrobium xinjiangense]|uniref:multiubiquitin domain-containing protein n=1 Tax=Salinimicrobium xinjiangense TaxID=438596 RepID=UPI0003FBFB10|nr:multiubiquitin domain-containing protein [Salinimicrobium xinjiangense]